MTVGMHYIWRRNAAKLAATHVSGDILDVASGTGDFAFDLLKHSNVEIVIGLDFSPEMLNVAISKSVKLGLDGRFIPVIGDAHLLPFSEERFASVTVGFGVRNFSDLPKALADIVRVTRRGGKVIVLEIVKPQGFLMARIFPMYFRTFTPVLGGIFAGEREAYDYLPQSVQGFKTASELAVTMENGGLRDVNVDLKALGTVAILSGRKPG
jgi:demethylmenaquinone methyltransferase/2-methoxy-6-polyprenyl-1,4-benzoquinol methylase